MKRIAFATATLMLFFCVAVAAQPTPPTPGPEHQKLGVFLGTWNGEGKSENSPFGKGGEIKSAMTCSWFAGSFHLVCDSEDTGPTGKIKSHSIYGYHPDKKQYYSFGADSTGYGGPGTAKVDGSVWTFEGQDTMGGKNIWFRTVVRLTSASTMTYRSDLSEDGKTWKLLSEGKMTRKP